MIHFLFGFALSFVLSYFLSSYMFRHQKAIAPSPSALKPSLEEKPPKKVLPQKNEEAPYRRFNIWMLVTKV